MENNKEIVENELLTLVNEYYSKHQLPVLNISDKDWNTLFNVIEAHLLVHNKMNEYGKVLNIIIKRAINYAKYSGDKEFTINHIKKALYDSSLFKIFDDEIDAIYEEIDERIKVYCK